MKFDAELHDAIALIRTVAVAIRRDAASATSLWCITSLRPEDATAILAFDAEASVVCTNAIRVAESPDDLDWYRRQAQAMADRDGVAYLVLPSGRVRVNAGGSRETVWSPAVVAESGATEQEKGQAVGRFEART